MLGSNTRCSSIYLQIIKEKTTGARYRLKGDDALRDYALLHPVSFARVYASLNVSKHREQQGPSTAHTMISSETIDNVQIVPKSLLVLLGSQDGSYLALPDADPVQIVLAEEQMVRAHFARNRQSLQDARRANPHSRATETDSKTDRFESRDLRRSEFSDQRKTTIVVQRAVQVHRDCMHPALTCSFAARMISSSSFRAT